MNQARWYNKNGTYELYDILFEDDLFVLVQNTKTKTLSFGPRSDFGSLYGFPVSSSCLLPEETVALLNDFIQIDAGTCPECVKRWKAMIKATLEHCPA